MENAGIKKKAQVNSNKQKGTAAKVGKGLRIQVTQKAQPDSISPGTFPSPIMAQSYQKKELVESSSAGYCKSTIKLFVAAKDAGVLVGRLQPFHTSGQWERGKRGKWGGDGTGQDGQTRIVMGRRAGQVKEGG